MASHSWSGASTTPLAASKKPVPPRYQAPLESGSRGDFRHPRYRRPYPCQIFASTLFTPVLAAPNGISRIRASISFAMIWYLDDLSENPEVFFVYLAAFMVAIL